jgi:polygalacturonase
MRITHTVEIPVQERGQAQATRRHIQSAIDDCAARGGGVVLLPAGEYVASSIELKSRVTLRLHSGCRLVSPVGEADFLGLPFQAFGETTCAAIIYALGCEQAAIEGGTIVGCGQSFWTPKETLEPSWRATPPRYWAKPFRPMTLLFQDCRGLRVEGLTIQDSPCYSAWVLSCRDVLFRKCRIENDFYGPNTDGCHFSACIGVCVEDCSFLTGDDAIAVDANDSGLSQHTVIRRCTFDSSVNVLRIYTGLDPGMERRGDLTSLVRDVSMYRCKVLNAAGVLNVTAQDGVVEDVQCYNMDIRMEAEGTAMFLMTDNGRVRNVKFRDSVVAAANGIATLLGTKTHAVEDVLMENLSMAIRPVKKLYELEIPDPIPSYAMHHFAPCNLYMRHVRGIRIRNLAVDWQRNPEFAHSFCAVALRDGSDVHLENVQAAAYDETGRMPPVLVERSSRVTVF